MRFESTMLSNPRNRSFICRASSPVCLASPNIGLDSAASLDNSETAGMDIFSHMTTKVEAVLKPQKQITIQSTGAAIQSSDTNLPLDARLFPTGGSSMSIFGLGEKEMSWEEFLQSTAGTHQDSWREAITSVVTSSHAGRIFVDNSQIILSSD